MYTWARTLSAVYSFRPKRVPPVYTNGPKVYTGTCGQILGASRRVGERGQPVLHRRHIGAVTYSV